ncbi:MAG: STAS domain-containing protein [Candidatus Zixiibacteriota bacterium]
MENIKVSIASPAEPVQSDQAISTLRIDGVVDTLTSDKVDQAIGGLMKRNQHRIVLDLAGVDYISSAGWGVFISHLKNARDNQGDLRLSGMIPNVREIYELLEFDTILSSFASVDQARDSFHSGSLPPEGGPRAPETSERGLEELTAIGVDAPFSDPHVGSADPEARSRASSQGADSPEGYLRELIAADPFASIAELKRDLNDSNRYSPVSWWWAFKTLWSQNLLSKRNRFRLARQKLRA